MTVKPPNNEQDIATIQKNEHLKRLIHDRLSSSNSSSLPNLSSHQERSVDSYEIHEVKEVFSKVAINNEEIIVEPNEKSDRKSEKSEAVVQRRVQFEEVNELEKVEFYEANFEANVENGFGESSTDSDAHEPHQVFASPNNIQDIQFSLPPPTPMKRKSRENSFESSNIVVRQDSEVSQVDSPDAIQETIQIQSPATTPPVVKPRTKRLVHRASDSSHEVIAVEADVSKAGENISKLENETLYVEVEVATKTNFKVDESDKIVGFDESEVPVVPLHDANDLPDIVPQEIPKEIQAVEVQAGPKSILKSSDGETTNSPKTITFQNVPHTISDSESTSDSSDDEDEEEDVWSRVNQHRYQLNRQKERISDVPPPLPKTPPPSEEEERQFSFA